MATSVSDGPVAAQAGGPALLGIDPGAFRDNFDRRPFRVRHALAGHPLFEPPRLVDLARRLPEGLIEYNAGDVPVSLDPGRTPRTGLSAEETIRRIEECRSWLVLKNVEREPEYAELLESCLREVADCLGPGGPRMAGKEGFVFVSSPGSVTPYHVDPEHNFLLQVRGSKTITVFDGRDRSVLSEEELERYYAGAHRNLVRREGPAGEAFELRPGDGVHVPVTHPHWVKNGGGVSVSFSITFRTPGLDRRQALYRVNHWLRGRGLRPAPPGRSPWRDAVKYLGFRLWRRGRRLLGRPAE